MMGLRAFCLIAFMAGFRSHGRDLRSGAFCYWDGNHVVYRFGPGLLESP